MVKEKKVLNQKMFDFLKQCVADPSLFLDGRLMKLKAKALDITYEGMIMFTRKNTRK